jgi:anti-anti-sigma factor
MSMIGVCELSCSEQGGKPASGRTKLFIETRETSGIWILHCAGRIHYRNEAKLLAVVAHPLLDGSHDLILDLRHVALIDSAGIGQLVLLHMRAKAAGRTVIIAAAPPHIVQLLELTNTAALFEFFDSVEDALEVWSREVA